MHSMHNRHLSTKTSLDTLGNIHVETVWLDHVVRLNQWKKTKMSSSLSSIKSKSSLRQSSGLTMLSLSTPQSCWRSCQTAWKCTRGTNDCAVLIFKSNAASGNTGMCMGTHYSTSYIICLNYYGHIFIQALFSCINKHYSVPSLYLRWKLAEVLDKLLNHPPTHRSFC